MEATFWKKRWQENQIGFHENAPNPLLLKHLEKLKLSRGDKVFVPLCGKSLDVAWLLSQGYRVIGLELVEIAVQQLFRELSITPKITQKKNFLCYFSTDENIPLEVWVGDIFHFSDNDLGLVDAIYDRAALIALPGLMRERYAQHLIEISNQTKQLLITLNYDQQEMAGPPFAIPPQEIQAHYGHHYQLTHIEKILIPGGLQNKGSFIPNGIKAVKEVTENAWLLT
jgi:thiopurine S-methyltransferase